MYCDLAQITEYLGVSETIDDALLMALGDNAKSIIDVYCGRVFSAETNTSRYFDALRDTNDAILYLDADLCEISTVINGDGTTIASNQYTTEPRNVKPYYALRLLGSGGKSWSCKANGDSENAISISGKWAYSVLPPASIVQAQIRLTAYLYRQKDNANDLDRAIVAGNSTILPQKLPTDIVQMLMPFRRLTT